MTLAEALGVVDGDVVSFVGAGGKTTAMFRLARELCQSGKRVVVTTTTRILAPRPSQALCSLELPDGELLLAAVRDAAGRTCPVVASRGRDSNDKLISVGPDWVARLRQVADVVLVEADGAAGRPFKAPGEHEPVIPDSATIVVPVVGVDVVGSPLSPEIAHRPEIVAKLAGIRMGEEMTPRVVADVMLHPRGIIKGAPAAARVVPLVNKVDGEERLQAARQLAQQLAGRGIRRVVLARCMVEPPVVEVLEAR
ncbi:MAG: putative selenium-dependent hydroxylase accessory protein YqeC [Chloroflexi bacterium]|nr:putative selenium-dependent hydroxylase accessory protein YqeC [Chloroflexota bacterium]